MSHGSYVAQSAVSLRCAERMEAGGKFKIRPFIRLFSSTGLPFSESILKDCWSED